MDPQLYSGGWKRISPLELSASDDVATALVLDPMLGFITMKKSSTHLPDIQCFTAFKETLLSFQRTQDFIWTVDTLICKLGDYFRSLGSNHKELLRRHMYCYLKAFLSDSGLRIEETKRYSTGSNEAKVTSTKNFWSDSVLMAWWASWQTLVPMTNPSSKLELMTSAWCTLFAKSVISFCSGLRDLLTMTAMQIPNMYPGANVSMLKS